MFEKIFGKKEKEEEEESITLLSGTIPELKGLFSSLRERLEKEYGAENVSSRAESIVVNYSWKGARYGVFIETTENKQVKIDGRESKAKEIAEIAKDTLKVKFEKT